MDNKIVYFVINLKMDILYLNWIHENFIYRNFLAHNIKYLEN